MDPKQRCVSSKPRALLSVAVGAAILAARVTTADADTSEPPVTVGVGVQTGFYSCQNACIYDPGTIKGGDGYALVGFGMPSM